MKTIVTKILPLLMGFTFMAVSCDDSDNSSTPFTKEESANEISSIISQNLNGISFEKQETVLQTLSPLVFYGLPTEVDSIISVIVPSDLNDGGVTPASILTLLNNVLKVNPSDLYAEYNYDSEKELWQKSPSSDGLKLNYPVSNETTKANASLLLKVNGTVNNEDTVPVIDASANMILTLNNVQIAKADLSVKSPNNADVDFTLDLNGLVVILSADANSERANINVSVKPEGMNLASVNLVCKGDFSTFTLSNVMSYITKISSVEATVSVCNNQISAIGSIPNFTEFLLNASSLINNEWTEEGANTLNQYIDVDFYIKSNKFSELRFTCATETDSDNNSHTYLLPGMYFLSERSFISFKDYYELKELEGAKTSILAIYEKLTESFGFMEYLMK